MWELFVVALEQDADSECRFAHDGEQTNGNQETGKVVGEATVV